RDRSRRERGDLSPRSRRQRHRALPRPSTGRVAARSGWEHGDDLGAARSPKAARRSGMTMRSSRRRLATVLGLFVASLFCVALVFVRNVHSGNVNFRYLIWNLFLAWIPFALAVFVYDRWRRRRGGLLLLYLGRFLRLNSWDALEHPSVLPRILHTVARDPFAYQEAIAVTVLFTVALSFAYFLLYNFAAVGLELDAER